MKKAALGALAILAVLSLAAWAVDISGTWEMSSPGRDGAMMTRDITIVQEGNKIKVTMPGRPGGDPITGEGTLEGNAIEWKIVRQGPQGEMVMTYKGTVDGNTMKGTTMRMDQEVEWTAKKK
ncbi:MAG: hypothetical protein IMZ57_06225 [Acidobacteria bacterium]|nr:hypothetical protein [Acidobacteriota bacterium]